MHIELKKLTMQLGLQLCQYYDFAFLASIYVQMGADKCAFPAVEISLPRFGKHTFQHSSGHGCAEDTRLSSRRLFEHAKMNPNLHSKHLPGANQDWPADSDTAGLTDGESGLEESWTTLPPNNQSDRWSASYDDIRSDDNSVTLDRSKQGMGPEDGYVDWQLVDRMEGCGI